MHFLKSCEKIWAEPPSFGTAQKNTFYSGSRPLNDVLDSFNIVHQLEEAMTVFTSSNFFAHYDQLKNVLTAFASCHKLWQPLQLLTALIAFTGCQLF